MTDEQIEKSLKEIEYIFTKIIVSEKKGFVIGYNPHPSTPMGTRSVYVPVLIEKTPWNHWFQGVFCFCECFLYFKIKQASPTIHPQKNDEKITP
ncbi:hypothetical protein [Bacillus pumilus]|uniref:hypothetical protein n=1 Tax=Bacillus pumilus TaxID=1408 RepID=UPI003D0481E4